MTCTPNECDLLPERAAIMQESGVPVTLTKVIEAQCSDCSLRDGKRLSKIMMEVRAK